MVLPYVTAFYLVIGLLEDTGYLPRLAVLMDTIMHRLGLHGYAIIPTLLGLGCNVPAILATRILESKRERFIAATLISIAVPCAALQAMILGLVGERGVQYVAIVYGTLFLVWIILGTILRYTVRGFTPELLIEIPPYRLPQWRAMLQKLWMRVSGFLVEAIPIILGAVLVINILYFLGVFEAIANFTAPVITNFLGLPKEAVTAIVIGFLRKDVALGMLAPLALSAKQLVVGSVVLAMFFPCIATFVVLLVIMFLACMVASMGWLSSRWNLEAAQTAGEGLKTENGQYFSSFEEISRLAKIANEQVVQGNEEIILGNLQIELANTSIEKLKLKLEDSEKFGAYWWDRAHPKEFGSVGELKAWLAQDDTDSTLYIFGSGCVSELRL